MAYNSKFFTGKNDGSYIENFIACHKFDFPRCWKDKIGYYLKDEAAIWWKSLDNEILKLCYADKIEKLFLDKWSHIGKKETKKLRKDLIFTGKDDGLTIEEFIKRAKSEVGQYWRPLARFNFRKETAIWWQLLDCQKHLNLPHEEFEKILFRQMGSC